jgi:tRNA nucleotidyltransferase (CCA-adding enzyme)
MIIEQSLEKYLIYSPNPSILFEFLRTENLIGYYTELNSLIGCIQESEWHPEGDVWNHTLLVLDVAAELREQFNSENDKFAFMLGALCHDFGKPYTNNYESSRIRSIMHDRIGTLVASIFLNKFDIDNNVTNKALLYVSNHLIPMQLFKNRQNVSKSAIIKLQNKIHIPDLVLFTKADHWGRTDFDSVNRVCDSADWLMEQYQKIL